MIIDWTPLWTLASLPIPTRERAGSNARQDFELAFEGGKWRKEIGPQPFCNIL
jgi:hypothetical protein